MDIDSVLPFCAGDELSIVRLFLFYVHPHASLEYYRFAAKTVDQYLQGITLIME